MSREFATAHGYVSSDETRDFMLAGTYLASPPVAAGIAGVKVWSGSAWADKPAKVWSGSAWVQKPVKTWNGTSWV